MIHFKNIADLVEKAADPANSEWFPVVVHDRRITMSDNCLKRMEDVGRAAGASIVYSYYRLILPDGSVEDHPLIPYQNGSLRDDFDFGGIMMLNSDAVRKVYPEIRQFSDYPDGGLYALRLALSGEGPLVMIPEYLYTMDKIDFRASGQKQHDYVDPRAREYQEAMERTVTWYLSKQDALVSGEREEVIFREEDFPVCCSVIIPVKNRVSTISDAVRSALGQKADFRFNVIVVDNASTDGTSSVIDGISDERLVVIHVAEDSGLGIGGCWNLAVNDPRCGAFAVQLDSDDLYSSDFTLQAVVDEFRRSGAAMVIGSYTMTDFDLNILPPGLIDHKEWTDGNGANNALRINGFGAPRAFYTPVIREIGFPDVSYGEDYAVCLRISRTWKVGRIFSSLYLCRRWKGNSDASLDVLKVNEHNYYKDFLRSCEFSARKEIGK